MRVRLPRENDVTCEVRTERKEFFYSRGEKVGVCAVSGRNRRGGRRVSVVTFTSLTVHKLPNLFTHVSLVSACRGRLVE